MPALNYHPLLLDDDYIISEIKEKLRGIATVLEPDENGNIDIEEETNNGVKKYVYVTNEIKNGIYTSTKLSRKKPILQYMFSKTDMNNSIHHLNRYLDSIEYNKPRGYQIEEIQKRTRFLNEISHFRDKVAEVITEHMLPHNYSRRDFETLKDRIKEVIVPLDERYDKDNIYDTIDDELERKPPLGFFRKFSQDTMPIISCIFFKKQWKNILMLISMILLVIIIITLLSFYFIRKKKNKKNNS